MRLLFWKDPVYIRGMTTPDMKAILEELAAGRIDAAEAARRIDALKASQSTSETPHEPTNEELAGSEADADPWAAATDRPQTGYGSDASQPEMSTEEPEPAKPVSGTDIRPRGRAPGSHSWGDLGGDVVR